MALMRRDVAIAGLVIFIAWGFITQWAPVLRYIGYAFVAGVISSLLAAGALILLSVRRKKDVCKRSFRSPRTAAFVAPEAWKAETSWLATNIIYKQVPLYPHSFVVSDGLDSLLDTVIRSFVSSWYNNITRNPKFVNEIDRAVRAALISIRERIENVDLVEIAVARFIPIFTIHMKEFYDAERAVRGKNLNRNVTESEELDLAIAGKYHDGRLHSAASLKFSDTKIVQQEYLRKLVVRLMPEVLPESMLKSRAVSVLIKEIVACAVLTPAMQMLSDPDTWNQLMEAYVRL